MNIDVEKYNKKNNKEPEKNDSFPQWKHYVVYLFVTCGLRLYSYHTWKIDVAIFLS